MGVVFSHFKTMLAALVLLLLFPLCSQADTVFLKNGMTFTSDRIWEENGEIKCYRNGLIVGFPKEDVTRIDKTPQKSVKKPAEVGSSSEAGSNNVEYGLAAVKKQLDLKKTALDQEYQGLLQEANLLGPDKNQGITGQEADRLKQRILNHNRKVREFELKKKAFDSEIQAYQKQLEDENLKQLIDSKKFSEEISTWLNQPVDNFIAAWGYPDHIVNLPGGNSLYLFVIKITPELTRQIIFDINRAGEIVSFQTKNGKN